MAIQIFDCAQNSPEWYACRLGLVTSSMFKTVLGRGKGDGESLTRGIYLRKLAGEIITGEPMENYQNENMIRGQQMEDEARSYYAFQNNVEMQRIGFVRNGAKGCAFPHILIDKLLKGTFPPEHKAQCQGGLWVCERDWIDLSIYWPRMPTFTIREFRDELYIAQLSREVDRFNEELAETVERVRKYGQAG